MCDFAGTRAEREWLATLKRIASALESIAESLKENSPPEKSPDEEEPV